MFRTVVEDTDSNVYMLERLAPLSIDHKRLVAEIIDYCHQQGIKEANPYLKTKDGHYQIRHQNEWWQVSRYIEGVPLPRPDYIWQEWRGGVLADWLLAFREQIGTPPGFSPDDVFSLESYINELFQPIQKNHPAIAEILRPIRDHVQPLFDAHDSIPPRFAHGDYHPVNVIWGAQKIRAVIDWEFCGYKPEGYDAALLVGCVGSEHPDALLTGLVPAFLGRLKKDSFFADITWKHFLRMVIAIRFAWMSEWLRKKDADMQQLELDYVRLLVRHSKRLEDAWDGSGPAGSGSLLDGFQPV